MSLSIFFRAIIFTCVTVGLMTFLVSCDHYGATGGGGSNHVQEAIAHANEAVEHGNMGHG
ncbi:MAG: small metal-binding protein SmbP [Nitrospirae bacterium]|nr:small metal-binding protein SmbP [Nitrospirota bacterium]MDA1304769.1 small metal-binding protein SmbP [Nitrospirota bacterium]